MTRGMIAESEAGFQDAIVEAAHLLGWRAVHFRPARTAHGWRTPGQYDAAGWPDLILVRSPRIVAIECKARGKRPTPEQAAWLAALATCGIETHLAEPVRLRADRGDPAMTRRPVHVVGLLDHSDHRADPRCPCRPEPARDLAEPETAIYVHPRPVPLVADVDPFAA